MLTNEQIDAMDNRELNKQAKARGLKIKTMSPFQIREHPKANPQEIEMTTKTKAAKKSKTVKAKKVRPVRDGTKSAKALEIFNDNKKLPRKVVIELFMKKLQMSKAGASTYYQNCKTKMSK